MKKTALTLFGFCLTALTFGQTNNNEKLIELGKTYKDYMFRNEPDGKRFIGYEIVNRLKAQGKQKLLLQLENAVNSSDKKKGKLHEVWEDSFDWKECNSSKFIIQKLDYMHNNPCTGKWNLAVNALEYLHSSAKFYSY